MTNWIRSKVAHNFDIRWAFEYSDGTPKKFGQWTMASKNPKDMASFQKTTNLSRCLIEYRDIRTYKEGVAGHIQGQDFCLFQWEGLGVAPSGAFGKGEIKLATGIIGLSIVCRNDVFTMWTDSIQIFQRARTDDEKKINFKTYG